MLDQAEGTVQKLAGRVQDAVGAVTGDTSTQAEGKARQAAGEAQKTYGEVVDQIRETAVTNPLVSVAVLVGLGFVLGAVWTKR
ncbi:CsbD family protein [Xylophilus sp. GOD-11R]|uniref:CsbD family protein n=1 Tax=Xylophilus sp. GOD-11R TaxID=3089814 RepID=UPI00298C11AC|nr:CsbD family protein [Xylophilus sp. GOD-11R]WPB58358.1 CsbD family protein [Xylophilus sp. GOD-11R]